MLNSNRAYALGAGSAVFSQGISALAGVASLWLLARILNTDQFAGYVVAMSVLTLVGFNAGLALERSMVLRVAELPVVPKVLAGRGLMLRILVVVVFLAVFAMLGVLLYAHSAQDAGSWLTKMSPMIPATAVGLTLTAWFHANHRVGTSAIMQALTDGSRCLFFLSVFLVGLGPPAVAYSAVLASTLPIFALSWLALGKSETAPSDLRLKDLGAGLVFLVIRVSQMGLRQFDIIIVGMFATGLEIAQYAIASRISALAAVGHIAFANTYMPRVRRHMANSDEPAIKREFQGARLLAFLMTLLAAIAVFALGSYALAFFGNFEGGYTALLLLMAAQLLNAVFGMQTEHLAMSGHLRIAAFIRAFTTTVFVIALLILVPHYSTLGAGISAMLAALIFGFSGLLALRRYGNFTAFSPAVTGIAAVSMAAMTVGAFVPDLWGFALCVLVVCFVSIVVVERTILLRIIRAVLNRD